MGTHLIIGSGAVGQATARELADNGYDVAVVSRSGTATEDSRITSIAANANDAKAIANAASKIEVIYNCANPAYHRWAQDWPPLANSILQAAQISDAVLVTMSNLYGYGPLDEPMTENHPLNAPGTKGKVRAQMWRDALAAHEKGHVRVTEARASDFIGAGLGDAAHMGSRSTSRALSGKTVSVVGSAKVAHSWTAINDVAQLLARLGTDPAAWGKPWHVPTADPLSSEELIHLLCKVANLEPVKVRSYSAFEIRLAGLFSKTIRELEEIYYQFEQPFVLDSSHTSNTFDLKPTAIEDVLGSVVEEHSGKVA